MTEFNIMIRGYMVNNPKTKPTGKIINSRLALEIGNMYWLVLADFPDDYWEQGFKLQIFNRNCWTFKADNNVVVLTDDMLTNMIKYGKIMIESAT